MKSKHQVQALNKAAVTLYITDAEVYIVSFSPTRLVGSDSDCRVNQSRSTKLFRLEVLDFTNLFKIWFFQERA